jgi:uncharacterized membrane protein YheB (UPF0754 family)
MVVRLSEQDPMLTNRLFHEVGAKEFRFIMWFGGAFGFVMGFPTILLVLLVPHWWMLPLTQAVIGCITNWIGIWMIYEPSTPKRIGPFKLQGLFLRRQHAASATYGEILSDDVLTLRNIGDELLHGPRSDRTRKLIEDAVRPVVDRAAGQARGLVRAAIGADEYDSVRDAVAVEAVEHTLGPLQDPELNRERNPAVRELVTERMRELSPEDFSETMRAATREDEWMLIAHGALFGIGGGLIHWLLFGV